MEEREACLTGPEPLRCRLFKRVAPPGGVCELVVCRHGGEGEEGGENDVHRAGDDDDDRVGLCLDFQS